MKKQHWNTYYSLLVILLCFLWISPLVAQEKSKQTTNYSQSWAGINTTVRLNNNWGFSADASYRANDFFSSKFYTIARMGVNYWLNNNLIFTFGYAHQWNAPKIRGWQTTVHENRLYQQVLLNTKLGKITFTNRLRNEEQWQARIINDTDIHSPTFTNRIRYQFAVNIPITSKPYLPSVLISDELCVQMGHTVVFNTFDQNRAFIGLRESFTKNLYCDIGYSLINQQKSTGYQYDQDHLFRIFLFYNLDLSNGEDR